jgi:hypothetical protein
MNKKIIAIGAVLTAGLLVTAAGCSDADKAADNMGVKAENFEVQREITGINTRSGEYLFHYIGRCSLETGANSAMPGYLQIMCKHGPDDYRKHFEKEATDTHISTAQLGPIDVSVYHTDIRIKPEMIIPQITVETGKQ